MSEAKQLFMDVSLSIQSQSVDAVEALNTFRGPQGPKGDPGSIDNLTINGKKTTPVDGENRIDLTATDVGALPAGGTAKDSEKLDGKNASEYLTTDKVVNNFTTTESGFVADARALKELRNYINRIRWTSNNIAMSFGVGETVAAQIDNCINATELTPIAAIDVTSSNPLLISNHWGTGSTKNLRITNLSGMALNNINVKIVCLNLGGI